jgi:transcription elongation factor Elf1
MVINQSVKCPYCTAECELEIDSEEPSHQFTVECQSCGQPFEVRAECEPGEIVSLEITET